MFNNKKGSIMRHPYVTLAVLGLATVGAVGIGQKVKSFVDNKTRCISGMVSSMKKDTQHTISDQG